MLWLQSLSFVAGLIALALGANVLVRGASRLALSFGLSPLVVGLTIVAFGTSAPEVAVSVGAVLDGRSDIAVGNVVGSNILNVLLILGASALIAPLVVHVQLIRQEIPVMLGASLLLLALALDGRIQLWEGGFLLVLLLAYTSFLIVQSRQQGPSEAAEFDEEIRPAGRGAWDAHWAAQLALIAVGLVLLVAGSNWLVGASVAFARALGVSDVVIALTIVAAGTSMPEIATSLTAAFKGERDIAVGNVVGSNVFNILGCVGASGLAAGMGGLAVASSVLNFDIWVMLAVAIACLPVFLTGREIARWEGGVFLGYYAVYVAYLILAAQQHDALGTLSASTLGFVLPLTIVTLVVVWLRQERGHSP